jgi:uncharacterized membrane protein YeiH
LIVLVLGTMTGVTGDVLRDAIRAHPPLIRRREIHAAAAIAGITSCLALQALGVSRDTGFVAGTSVMVGVRLHAIRWGVHLPTLRASLDR